MSQLVSFALIVHHPFHIEVKLDDIFAGELAHGLEEHRKAKLVKRIIGGEPLVNVIESNCVNPQVFTWTASLSNKFHYTVFQVENATPVCLCGLRKDNNWASSFVVKEAVIISQLLDAEEDSTRHLTAYLFWES